MYKQERKNVQAYVYTTHLSAYLTYACGIEILMNFKRPVLFLSYKRKHARVSFRGNLAICSTRIRINIYRFLAPVAAAAATA